MMPNASEDAEMLGPVFTVSGNEVGTAILKKKNNITFQRCFLLYVCMKLNMSCMKLNMSCAYHVTQQFLGLFIP